MKRILVSLSSLATLAACGLGTDTHPQADSFDSQSPSGGITPVPSPMTPPSAAPVAPAPWPTPSCATGPSYPPVELFGSASVEEALGAFPELMSIPQAYQLAHGTLVKVEGVALAQQEITDRTTCRRVGCELKGSLNFAGVIRTFKIVSASQCRFLMPTMPTPVPTY